MAEPHRSRSLADSDLPIDFILARASATWRYHLESALRPHGLTYSTWRTLAFMQRDGDGMVQKELARFMGVEAPTLVRLLDRLAAEGFVVRRSVPGDRRANTVHLSTHAHEVLEELNEVAAALRRRLLEGIPADRLADCRKALETIIAKAKDVGAD